MRRGAGGHHPTAGRESLRSRVVTVTAGVALVLGMLGASGVVSWTFLERYRDPSAAAPAGSDTAHHQWRIEVVTDAGLAALPAVETRAQALNTNADRPGLPIAGAVASATGVADPRELAYLLPALMAMITGLTAAGFARAAMHSTAWGLPAYVVGVGASVQVALTANGYFDQLLVMPLLIGAGACVVSAACDRRVYPCAVILLGAAFVVHWQFASAFTLLLALVPLGAAARSLREHRDGADWRTLPSVSSAVTAGGGLLVGALALTGAGPLRTPLGLTHEGIAGNIARQLPRYRFPIPAITALGGITALWTRPRARPSLWLLGPWASVPAVAALVFAVGLDVPVQRALTFALALPILSVALAETVVRAGVGVAGRTSVSRGRIVAVLLITGMAGAVAWFALAGHGAWVSRPTPMSNEQFAQLQATARYLDAAGGPAVVVVDVPESGRGAPGRDFGSVPAIRRLRAQLAPDLILDARVYLGHPGRLLQAQPTLRPDVPGFDETSRELWASVQPLLEADPAIIVLRPFYRAWGELVRDHPEWKATDWLAIVRGPAPADGSLALGEPRAPGVGSLAAKAGLILLVAGVAGLGWTWAAGPADLLARSCLAPAAGIAAIVLVGL
ncbi:MAG TPA: hypothetical protein VF351_05625, partial [Actinomycetota bacterium]